uniref:Uncharacterized protein n=1 Tax=Plectus sambesii TaxID=2011161 RepID=A0A914WEW0_9BILA
MALRIQKEMLIIAGMAGVDTIYGLGAFLFGIYRLALIADGSSSTKVTQWDCLSGMYVAHGKILKAAVHEMLNDQQAKRQRRLTVTIGVITVSTSVKSYHHLPAVPTGQQGNLANGEGLDVMRSD